MEANKTKIGDVSWLANIIGLRWKHSERPFRLVLGVDASGLVFDALASKVIRNYSARQPEYLESAEICDEFSRLFGSFSEYDQHIFLMDELKGVKPAEGHECLARLIKAEYFDTIVLTGIDQLIEDALQEEGVQGSSYILYVAGRPGDDLTSVRQRLKSQRVCKIVKLFGDLMTRTEKIIPEQRELSQELQGLVEEILKDEDVIVVGYHSGCDNALEHWLEKSGSVWYVNPEPPSPDSRLYKTIKSKPASFFVAGPAGDFNYFFRSLYQRLEMQSTSVASQFDIQVLQQLQEMTALLEEVRDLNLKIIERLESIGLSLDDC